MDILDKVALYRALMVPRKTTDAKQPWKTIYEIINDE